MPRPLSLMPGPPAYPLIGNLLQYTALGEFSFERLHVAKQTNHARYGPVYLERLGPRALVQVFDPRDAGRVLRADGRCPRRPALPITLTAHRRDGLMLGLGSLNGVEWRNLRSAVQTLMMLPLAAAAYLPAQNAVADDFLTLIDASLDDTRQVADINPLLLKYTMESIGTVCFNNRLGCLQHHLAADSTAHALIRASAAMFEAVQTTMFAFPWYALMRSPRYTQFIEAKRTCDRIALQYVEDCYKMAATAPHKSTQNGPNFLTSLVGMGTLDPQSIVGITLELFIAGIDSTANALAFVLYNLASNQEAQHRLRSEIIRALPDGAPPTHHVIHNMTYLRACVKESFRLNFPVEGGTIRVLNSDVVLGGYLVPRNTTVALNQQTMCLQERYFHDAQRYLPERWLKTGSATQRPPPQFVMLPFGHGPRMCVGRRFAEQEIYLAIVKILQKYSLSYDGRKLGMINRVFTVPDGPLTLKFTDL